MDLKSDSKGIGDEFLILFDLETPGGRRQQQKGIQLLNYSKHFGEKILFNVLRS